MALLEGKKKEEEEEEKKRKKKKKKKRRGRRRSVTGECEKASTTGSRRIRAPPPSCRGRQGPLQWHLHLSTLILGTHLHPAKAQRADEVCTCAALNSSASFPIAKSEDEDDDDGDDALLLGVKSGKKKKKKNSLLLRCALVLRRQHCRDG
jgi:hypothetical protein